MGQFDDMLQDAPGGRKKITNALGQSKIIPQKLVNKATGEELTPSQAVDSVNGGKPQAEPKKLSLRATRYAALNLRTPRNKNGVQTTPGAKAPVTAPDFPVEKVSPEKTAEQRDIEAGEAAWSAKQKASGSPLRSLNGVTYDINEYAASLPGNKLADFEGPSGHKFVDSTSSSAIVKPYTPLSAEDKSPSNDKPYAGVRLNTKNDVDAAASVPAPEAKETKGNINARIEAKYKDRKPGKYVKPAVEKPGNVIPQAAIDTATSPDQSFTQETAQQDAARGSRSPMRGTSAYSPNTQSARATVGMTPERALTVAAKTERFSQKLNEKGATFAPHAPHVVETAKGLAASEGVSYESDAAFHKGPHMRKAYVLHAAGVANAPEKLDAYLGKRPADAADRLQASYDMFQDHERNGVPGEDHPAELLGEMIRSGKTVSGTRRAVERGQTVQLDTTTAAPVSGSRTAQRASRRRAGAGVPRGSIAAGPGYPPEGKSGLVSVSKIDKATGNVSDPVLRPLTDTEKGITKDSSKDDSKNLVATAPKTKGKQWEQVEPASGQN